MRDEKTIILQLPIGSNDLVDEVVDDEVDAERRAIGWVLRRFLADHEYGVAFITRLDNEKAPWSELAQGLDIQPDSLRRAYNRHCDDAVRHCQTWWARLKGSSHRRGK